MPRTSPHPNFPPYKVAAKKPDPDREIRIAQAIARPKYVWYFIICLIGLASVSHFGKMAWTWYSARFKGYPWQRKSSDSITPASDCVGAQERVSTDDERSNRGPISLRRLPVAIVDAMRAIVFRWSVPISLGKHYTINIMEVFLTAVYIVICFTWTMVNTTSTKGFKWDPHYYANIAANIASTQLTLVTALGMKNNIISLLTGIGYDKLLYLHRATARVLVVLIWVHATGRVRLGLIDDIALTNPRIQSGVLAAVSLTLLSILSIHPLRDRAYEVFLIGHLLLAFIILLAAYFHASTFDFGSNLVPSFVFWAFDRFLRLIRVASFSNFGFPLNRESTATSSPTTSTEAIITPLTDKFLRVTVRAPRHFRWKAGQNAYLTFFGGPEGELGANVGVGALPMQAHPFTIAAICEDGEENNMLRFFIHVRGGITERLWNVAIEGSTTTNEVNRVLERAMHVKKRVGVLLDGPYSSPPTLVGYDTVLLLAGGSGITFPLPLMLDLMQRSKSDKLVCRRLTFVWMIRHLDHVSWIDDALCKACADVPNGMTLAVHLYVTREKIKNSTSSSNEEGTNQESTHEDEEKAMEIKEPSSNDSSLSIKSGAMSKGINLLTMSFVHVHYGRANLESLVANELTHARETMSVNVCGRHSLIEAVRRALRYPRVIDILRGGPTVELHVEGFGGA